MSKAYCHDCGKGVKAGKCKSCGSVNPPCSGCRVQVCDWTQDKGCKRLIISQKARQA